MVSIPEVKSQTNLSEVSGDTASCADLSLDEEFSSSRRVSFGPIHVREYERVIGDHPMTKIGVPLSLGWGYVEKDEVSLSNYERDRPSSKPLRMSSITRKNILRNVFGFSEEELREAEQEVKRIKTDNDGSLWKTQISKKKKPSKLKKFGQKFRNYITTENFIKGLSAVASPSSFMIS